jgi:2,3,4,5-tetrahydropyridine-2-carboxylate N-succinyltransferase
MSDTFASPLSADLDDLWERRAEITADDTEIRDTVIAAVDQIDAGTARVAQIDPESDQVIVDERAKRAILLSFRVLGMVRSQVGDFQYNDRIPLKTRLDGVRVVPGAIARWGSHLAPGVVLMPSFTNIGAYVDAGTMVDTWATVGSCAQIGKNVHLSGGVGIGGVLEPLQANPTIIEDNCFVGARSEVVEGVIVEENSVISMGVFIGQSTKIYDRATGAVTYGRVPAGSVVVSGSLPSADGSYSLYCAVIVKKVDAQTRSKTSINDLLRA